MSAVPVLGSAGNPGEAVLNNLWLLTCTLDVYQLSDKLRGEHVNKIMRIHVRIKPGGMIVSVP